jgi:integration host factor subunit beta
MITQTPTEAEDEAGKKQRARLTKLDLVKAVAKALELPHAEGARIVELIFDGIVRALRRGDKVAIRGFGSFRLRQRGGRTARNPKTGARVEVPAKKIPYFTPGRELKALINRAEREL